MDASTDRGREAKIDTELWDVRDLTGLVASITALLLVYSLLAAVLYKTSFRAWLFPWLVSRNRLLRKASLPVFYVAVKVFSASVYFLALIALALVGLVLHFGSRELPHPPPPHDEFDDGMPVNLNDADVLWGNFRNKPLAVIFFGFYLLLLLLLFLFWKSNQWSLAPQLRFVSAGRAPLRFLIMQDDLWADQAARERVLRVIFAALVALALLCATFANIWTIPFGECPVMVPNRGDLFVPCNKSAWWFTFEHHNNYLMDSAWHVAGNWVLITFNTLFVVAAVFYIDFYLHSAADLLVEVQARFAEGLMRYGMEGKEMDSEGGFDGLGLDLEGFDEVGNENHSSKHDDSLSAACAPPIPPANGTPSVQGGPVTTRVGRFSRKERVSDPSAPPHLVGPEADEPSQDGHPGRGKSVAGATSQNEAGVYLAQPPRGGNISSDDDSDDFLLSDSDDEDLKLALTPAIRDDLANEEAAGSVASPRAERSPELDLIPPALCPLTDVPPELKDEITRTSRIISGQVLKHLADQIELTRSSSRSTLAESSGQKSGSNSRSKSNGDQATNSQESSSSEGCQQRANSKAPKTPPSSSGEARTGHSYVEVLLQSHARTMLRRAILCYLISVLWLIAHAVVGLVFTTRSLTAFQMMGILMSDSLITVMFSHSAMQTSNGIKAGSSFVRASTLPTWVVALLLLAARLVVVSVPTDAWFVGQSAMYIIIAVFLSYTIIRDYSNWDGPAARDRRSYLASCRRCDRPGRKIVRFFIVFSHEILFSVFTIYFGLLTFILRLDDLDDMLALGSREFHERPYFDMLQDHVELWTFGVFALLIVVCYIASHILYIFWVQLRARAQNAIKLAQLKRQAAAIPEAQELIERSSLVIPSLFEALISLFSGTVISLSIALGLYIFSADFMSAAMFPETKEVELTGTVGTLMPALLVGLVLHQQWVSDDFEVFKKLPPSPPTAVLKAAHAGRFDARVINYLDDIRLVRSQTWWRNFLMGAGILFVCCCLIAWGLVLCYDVGLKWEFGAAFPCAIASIIVGIVGAELWFNSLQLSTSLIVLYVSHVSLILAGFTMGAEEVFEPEVSTYYNVIETLLLFLLLMPVLLLAVDALLVYRDDCFRLTKFVSFSLAFSVLVAALLGVWVSIRFTPFAAIMYYLVLIILVILGVVWVWWNASKLDRNVALRTTQGAGATVCGLVLIFTILGIYEVHQEGPVAFGDTLDPLNGLLYFLIAYIIWLLFSALWVLAYHRDLIRNSTKSMPSPSLLGVPVIGYHVENRGGELLLMNLSVVVVFAILFSLQGFGFIVSMIASPNTGVSISSVALCLIEVYALHMATVRCGQFRRNILALDGQNDINTVLERVMQEAVQRCLQISQQAMMATWLRDNRRRPSSRATSTLSSVEQSTVRTPNKEDIEMQNTIPHPPVADADDGAPLDDAWTPGFIDASRHHSTGNLAACSSRRGTHVEITTSDQLAEYYAELYHADIEHRKHLRDSCKYQALFHVLFWMRSTQLLLEQQVLGLKSGSSMYARVRGMTGINRLRYTSSLTMTESMDTLGRARAYRGSDSNLNSSFSHNHTVYSYTQTGFTREGTFEPDASFNERMATQHVLRNAVKRRKVRLRSSRHLARRSTHNLDRIADHWVHLTDEEAKLRIRAIRKQGRFVDRQFPATNGSLFLDWDDEEMDLDEEEAEDLAGALWCRAKDLFPASVEQQSGRRLIVANHSNSKQPAFDPREVMQGGVGNCWLLSAISVVALYPDLLNRVLVSKEPSEHGVFHVRLFLDGKWEHILVDDLFPCSLTQSLVFDPLAPHEPPRVCDDPPDYRTKHDPTAASADGLTRLPLPQFCRSRSGNVLWPLIIEKAFAKRFGSYEGLNGGHVHSALVDLTGGYSQLFGLRDDVELVVSGALWEKLMEFHRLGALLAAGSPAMSDSGNEELEDGALSSDPNGIVHGHAYAILRVEDQFDYNGHHRLLQLRDPWGVSNWRGPWSRYDTKRWTRRIQKRLKYSIDNGISTVTGLKQLEEKLGVLSNDSQIGNDLDQASERHAHDLQNDGTFWISLEDFVASFKWLYVCQIFDPLWIQKSISDEWKGASAGGPPNQPGARMNPQFSLRLIAPREPQADGLLSKVFRSKTPKTVKLFVSISNLQESQARILKPSSLASVAEESSSEPARPEGIAFARRSGAAVSSSSNNNSNNKGGGGDNEEAASATGRAYPFMSLLLLDIGGQRLDCELLAKTVVASTGRYKDSRDLSFTTQIPLDGSITYTLFPSLFPRGEEGTFRINVNCEADFELKKLNLA